MTGVIKGKGKKILSEEVDGIEALDRWAGSVTVCLPGFPKEERTPAVGTSAFLFLITVGSGDPFPAMVSQPGLGNTLAHLRTWCS